MYRPNNYMQPTSSLPITEQYRIREYHIGNLLQRFPNARIVAQDKSMVDVPLQLKNGQFLNFRVNLQSTFPQLPPIIQLLATAAEHRFLDKNQLVVHERLRMWHMNDHLGEALYQVFQDFLNFPPRIISYAVVNPTRMTPPAATTGPNPPPQQPQQPNMYNNTPTYQPIPSSSTTTTNSPSPSTQQQQQANDVNMARIIIPSQPSTFSEIEKLTPSEISSLLESEYKLKQFIESLEYIKSARREAEELRNKNIEKAKDNIKRNKVLEEKNEEMNKLKEEIVTLKASVQEKTLKQKEINERYQPQNVLNVLNRKIDEIETETEQMGDQFAINGGNWDEFMKSYMEKRSLYHLRQEKKKRFKTAYVK